MPNKKHSNPPKTFKLILISVAIGIVGGFFLIGIPGVLVLELIARAYIVLGMQVMELSGDQVWPTAIMISLLWPMAITPLSMLHFKLMPQQSIIGRWLFSLIGSLMLTLISAFLLLL